MANIFEEFVYCNAGADGPNHCVADASIQFREKRVERTLGICFEPLDKWMLVESKQKQQSGRSSETFPRCSLEVLRKVPTSFQAICVKPSLGGTSSFGQFV